MKKLIADKNLYTVYVPSAARLDGKNMADSVEVIEKDEYAAVVEAFSKRKFKPGIYESILVIERATDGKSNSIKILAHNHLRENSLQMA